MERGFKYESIAISGPAASGTTTAAKTVAQELDLTHHSAGDIFRQYALDNNIPLHAHMQFPDKLDREIDKKLTKLAEEGGVAIEGRYIGYLTRNMNNVLKVLLTADEDVRIQRAQKRIHTHIESAEEIKKREIENDKKFRKLYADEDFLNPHFFNLIIDTTNTTQEEVSKKIIAKFKTGVEKY